MIEKLSPFISVKSVRSFLEYVGFYRRFIKDFFEIKHPLCKLLEKVAKFIFDEACYKAFKELKHKLIFHPLMSHLTRLNLSRLCVMQLGLYLV